MKRILTACSLIAFAIGIFAGATAIAQVPPIMNYQGRLTNTDGAPLPDAVYSVTFSIYDSEVSPTALWQEILPINVAGGFFDIILGQNSPLPPSLFEIGELYLGIKVETDPELLPRIRITTGAYSFRSFLADVSFMASEVEGNSVDSSHLIDGSISLDDIAQSGAASEQVIKWSGTQWEVGNSAADGDWVISGSDIYSGVAGNVGIGTPTPDSKLDIDFGSTGSINAGTPLGSGPGWMMYAPNGHRRDIVAGSAGLGIGASAGSSAANQNQLVIWENGPVTINKTSGTLDHRFEVNGEGMGAGYFTSSNILNHPYAVLKGEYLGSNSSDVIAVLGYSKPQDYYGIGSNFEGGYLGTWGKVDATGSEMYIGVLGDVHFGTGTNIGVYGLAEDGRVNWGVLAWAQGGDNALGCNATAKNADTNYAIFADASGGTISYGVYGTASNADTCYAGYFVSDSMERGDVLHAEYQGTDANDIAAVRGYSAPQDFYGIGGIFEGGFMGVHCKVNPTGSDYYYGLNSIIEGGSGVNYGVSSYVIGEGINYGVISSAIGGGTNIAVHATAFGGSTNWAGYFDGDVRVVGTIDNSKSQMIIDHPLDPENKYLYHQSVNSPEMKNIYDGVAVLDANGEASVQMPDYFEALNENFRYQLTCIGGYATVFISEEINSNQFSIAGGKPGMKVSWQVTGNRKDAFALTDPTNVEVDKATDKLGRYLNPEAHGFGTEYGLNYEERSREKEMNIQKGNVTSAPTHSIRQQIEETQRKFKEKTAVINSKNNQEEVR